jgi:hypothetical protein
VRSALITALALLLIAGCARETADYSADIAKIDERLARLESAKMPEEAKSLIAQHREQIVRAKSAKSPQLQLYRLRDPYIGAGTLEYIANHQDAASNLDAFNSLWTNEGARFAQKSQPQAKSSWLNRALHEGAANRSTTLYEASEAYAKVSSPFSGLYYLAEAEGNRQFREYIASLKDSGDETPPPAGAVRSALAELEVETLKAFEKDPTNSEMIPVSVRLKETRELLDRGSVSGATLLLLESRVALSRRGGAAESRAPGGAVEGRDSMRALLRAMIDEGDADIAKIVRAEAAPLLTSLGKRKQAAVASAPVKVILVRWPYT